MMYRQLLWGKCPSVSMISQINDSFATHFLNLKSKSNSSSPAYRRGQHRHIIFSCTEGLMMKSALCTFLSKIFANFLYIWISSGITSFLNEQYLHKCSVTSFDLLLRLVSSQCVERAFKV